MSSASYSTLAGTIGVISCTTFFVMNTTLNYIAMPAYLLTRQSSEDRLRSHSSKPETSTDLLLRQWELTYSTGHLVGPGSSVLSMLAFIYAGWILPDNALQLGKWCYFAAVCAALPLPFTVIWILPTNDELYRRAALSNQTAKSPKSDNGTADGKITRTHSDNKTTLKLRKVDTLELIRKCHSLSKIRALMPLPAIVAAVYVMAATGKALRS